MYGRHDRPLQMHREVKAFDHLVIIKNKEREKLVGSFCGKVFTFAQVYLFLTFFCIADARNSPTFQTTAYWFKIQMTSAAECHIVEIPRTQHHWPAFPHSTRPCPPPPPCTSTLTSHHPSLEATLQPQSTVSIVYLKVLCT